MWNHCTNTRIQRSVTEEADRDQTRIVIKKKRDQTRMMKKMMMTISGK